MREKINKIIASLLIGCIVFLSIPYSIFASDSTKKEEVIYANLDNSGTLKSMYVVNAFHLDEQGEILDYGEYDSVTNLSNTNPISSENGTVRVTSEKGKFYYQGNISNKVLPWNIGIEYYLNGEKIQPQDLLGKQGELEIKLSFLKNPEVDASFFENYTLQATVTLAEDKASNIQAQGATIANVGNTKSLTYMVLAGSEKTYSIKATVQDFTMEGIQINGIALALDIDSPDTSSFTDKISTLQQAIKDLDTGASSLSTATKELNTGAKGLKTGIEKLNTGIETVNSGVDELAKGSKEVTIGGKNIKMGLDTVNEKSNKLQQSSNQIKTGLDTMSRSVNTMKNAIPKDANKQITSLQKGSKQYLVTLNQMIQSVPEGTQKETLKALRDSYISINDGVQEVVGITSSCITGTTQLADKLNTLSTSYQEFDVGMKQYTTSIATISKGYDSLYTGITKVDAGIDTLKSGTLQLKRGSYDLYKGASLLTNGSTQLVNGAQEMKEGTKKMKDETKNVDSQITDTIDEIIEEYTKTDFDVKSFVSDKNTNVSAVQFVLKTEGIKDVEEEKQVEQEEIKTSFWDKLMGLFK